MRRKFLLFSAALLGSSALFAQVDETTSEGYNKWSIDFHGGVNTAANPMTPGYRTNILSPFHADLGVRYMFNNKFGLKLDFGYDRFEDGKNSLPFESEFYRASLQGYVNLGRVLEFETWTGRFNLLAHSGFGISQLRSDAFSGEDNIGNFLIGLTGQVRLSNRVALNADFTMINNFSQQRTFDGLSMGGTRGFDGTLYNASIGLSIYLGKHTKHADWIVDVSEDKLAALDKRIGDIETMLVDSDQDGVPDYLDVEPNSIAGVAVDSKGRMIDRNQNGVPDELESYLERTYATKNDLAGASAGDKEVFKRMINEGYINVYFDFNKAQPAAGSTFGVDFLAKYLKANPSASVDIIGYSDEIGNPDYNKTLSERRATNVKNILVAAGIDASRLNVIGNGEDASVDKSSSAARQLVRRVTFKIK